MTPPPSTEFPMTVYGRYGYFWHHKFYFTSLDNFVHRKMGEIFFLIFFCEVKQFTKNNPVTLKFLCNISPNSILTLLN